MDTPDSSSLPRPDYQTFYPKQSHACTFSTDVLICCRPVDFGGKAFQLLQENVQRQAWDFSADRRISAD